MQNKQKAPFPGGDRVRCKTTSLGLQYKQSWLPEEAGSIQPSGASLHPPQPESFTLKMSDSLQSFSECFLGQKQ